MDTEKLRLAGAVKDKVYTGPRSVAIYLNRVCNLNCVYCSSTFERFKRGFFKKNHIVEFDYAMFKKLLEDIISLKVSHLVFSSHGETLMHSRFEDMLSNAKSNGLGVVILTNGTLLNKRICEQLTSKDSLRIHLSSFKHSLYKKIQGGSKESLKNVIKSVKQLSKKNYDKPKINFVVPVHYQNFGGIEDYLRAAKIAGADSVSFKWTESQGDFSFIYAPFDFNQRNIFKYSKRKLEVKKKLEMILKSKSSVIIKNNIQSLYDSAFKKKTKSNGLNKCFIGWYRSYVDLDGTVFGCCIHRKKLGNLKDKSFKEIWNSALYNQKREYFKYNILNKKNTSKLCKRFCAFKENRKIAHKIENFKLNKS